MVHGSTLMESEYICPFFLELVPILSGSKLQLTIQNLLTMSRPLVLVENRPPLPVLTSKLTNISEASTSHQAKERNGTRIYSL